MASVKCVVWDLDNTLWDGILLEDTKVSLRQDVVDVIRTLDERGILHSIASRNDRATAMAKLREFGLEEYFLYPQINWESKSASVHGVAKALNIGLDTIAFVDDQAFERDEVAFAHPAVRCISAEDAAKIASMPDMNPRFITEDSRIRRQMYLADIQRKIVEDAYQGPPEAFLASLDMSFVISWAKEEDLKRAEELTVRTNQLNATGYTYSYEELDELRKSPRHDLLVASLDDKYGTYGKIGLALVERGEEAWSIKLLLMSCRVISRGVGTVLLTSIMQRAKEAGVRLRAEFVPTDRNRTMFVTYRFAGFREVEKRGAVSILETDFSQPQDFPPYMKVIIEGLSCDSSTRRES
ncbi:HAD-IIIC family phosphatase [Sorangium sp. So ce1151]|uniref:HAD-IIIC family phosphatase n=1 Tax=Sorangium sp. So ce1151 TaxID=3133332 RepID=UPI003F5F49B3